MLQPTHEGYKIFILIITQFTDPFVCTICSKDSNHIRFSQYNKTISSFWMSVIINTTKSYCNFVGYDTMYSDRWVQKFCVLASGYHWCGGTYSFLHQGRGMQYIPPEWWYPPAKLHGFITQETTAVFFTNVQISNLLQYKKKVDMNHITVAMFVSYLQTKCNMLTWCDSLLMTIKRHHTTVMFIFKLHQKSPTTKLHTLKYVLPHTVSVL
jgi:hypothetical protein